MITDEQLFIINYCHSNCQPLKNIMRLPKEEAFTLAAKLAEENKGKTAFWRFADFAVYYPERLATDKLLYERFAALGGKPREEHPLSFVLQGSESVDNWFDNGIVTKISLSKIASEHVSFTLGDSMSTLKRNGDIQMLTKEELVQKVQEYPGSLEEFMEEIREKYGYIEVQLWSDEYVVNKNDLLFYTAYEEFYAMAAQSEAFKNFCREAFGEDFSQDGFSDIEQINKILQYIPKHDNVHILDVGCGNGKMLSYLQKKTGVFIHGFDYSEKAIETAKKFYPANSEFREGIIGETEYEAELFDLITSMDTMYFAKDMTDFVSQIKRWLKPDGLFFVGYQEGDVMPKTKDAYTTVLAEALRKNGMPYEVEDITRQTYELLLKKRAAAENHKGEFEAEGNADWYEMLIGQTEYANMPYEEFQKNMARYLYVVRK